MDKSRHNVSNHMTTGGGIGLAGGEGGVGRGKRARIILELSLILKAQSFYLDGRWFLRSYALKCRSPPPSPVAPGVNDGRQNGRAPK